MHIKIADFGTHKVFEGEHSSEPKTFTGTLQYMAPEVAKNERIRQPNKYAGPPVDIFACGVLLFFMLTCEIPFRKALTRQHKAILTDSHRARTDE